MPMTLECADPSQDRMIKRSLFSFWPTLFQYEVILESPASGIFYFGYQRVRDIGRELWLSMDDLTRHIMFFATTGGGKTETIFAWAINPLCWARGFTLSMARHRMIRQERSGIWPDALAVKTMWKSSTS